MSNFELIDDYLANRLSQPDLKAFEEQLSGDPALKEEVELQRQIVEGVRQARAAELKSMLNNVPVGGSSWGGGKIAAVVVSAGLMTSLLYFYMNQEPTDIALVEDQKQEIAKLPDNKSEVALDSSKMEMKEETSVTNEPVKEKAKTTKETKVTSPVRKPDIKVVDPSGEFAEAKEPEKSVTSGRSEIKVSKIEVTTGLGDKKHNFHYQFVQGKLLLFGPFDKSIYELLEIHGVDQTLFLWYKENYYLLDEKQSQITKLDPIRNGELLKKLREYRGQ